MANDSIEVEIKFPVTKKEFAVIKKNLRKKTAFKSSSRDVDRYFNPPHRSFLDSSHPTEYLRIRESKDDGSLTYKNVHLNKHGERTHSDEFESKLDKPEQIIRVLNVLNFDNFISVKKQREKYVYKDKYEIVLDIVEGLGYFVEIEALDNTGGVEFTRRRILAFAKEIGIKKHRKCNGYVIGLMRKKGLLRD